ncbi:MAG: DUF748 domain-containing protein [Leptothrix sp. (in: b-proteobacteria)]
MSPDDAPSAAETTAAEAPTAKPASDASAASPAPRRRLPRAARVALWLVGTPAVLALAWTLLVGQWLPGFIQPRIEAAVADELGVPVSIGHIAIAPWTLVVQVDQLRIGAADAPILTLAGATTQLSLQSIKLGAPVLASLTLTQPVLNVQRLDAQRFNFSAALQRALARKAARPPSPPARFALHNIRIEGGALHYADPVLQTEHHVEALRIGLPFISSLPADVATDVQPLIEARIDGSELRLEGNARPFATQRSAELTLTWRSVPLAPWAGVLRALLPPALAPDTFKGLLDAQLVVSFEAPPASTGTSTSVAATPAASAASSAASTAAASSPDAAPVGVPRLRVRGELALRDVDVSVPGQGLSTAWHSLRVDGIDLLPLQRQHRLEAITLDGLRLVVHRPGAPPKPGETAAAAAPSAESAPEAPAASTAQASPPLRWQLDRLDCKDCSVHVSDTSLSPPVQAQADAIELTLQHLASHAAEPWAFDLTTLLAAGAPNQAAPVKPGRLTLVGTLQGLMPPADAAAAALPFALDADIGLDAIDLRALQPYLAPHLNLTLVAAQVGTQGRLSVRSPAGAGLAPDRLSVHYQGRANLANLSTQDSVNGADFLGWRQLAFDGLDVGVQGSQVNADLGRVTLDGLQARVILNPDARLNLADLVKGERGAAPQSVTTPKAAASAPGPGTPAASGPSTPAAASPLQLRWQSITLRDGTVQFTDHFIKPNYSARLTRLKGDISALSSAAPAPAKVALAGALDDGAPLRINGSVHPLGARLYTDIEASARGIALTRMSTYAERYAGYAIEKGSMSVTVRYQIDKGRLQAENQLFLDQLTFGDAVDSPDALKLPVRLAVALLKNSRGEIDVRLPVSGTLDDPQFSVGGVVWRVFVNLLTRAVTAPFAFLMGGDSNEASALAFAPGSAELDTNARSRLDDLARKLVDKPTLKLEATGQADPAADADALQAAHAAAMAAEAARKAAAQAPASPSAPSRSAPAPSASAPSPAGAASAAAAAIPPAPPLDAAALNLALRQLADDRGDRVLAYLADKLPAERVLLNRSKVSGERPEGDTTPAARVQFNLR